MTNSNFIEQQKWRYATKKYDSNKKISKNDLDIIIEAAQLSTSSYGLQPYQIIHIQNQELRQSILPLAWNQQQIVDASDLFIIANYKKLSPNHLDKYMQLMADVRQVDKLELMGYQNFIKSKIFELDDEAIFNWTQKQCYLVLANMMNAAASLKIDATPMEGFSPKAINELLNLDDKNLNATLMITLGYRHQEDKNQYLKKVRKPISDLVIML